MRNKMTNIKERVLHIAEVKGISKIDFFKDLGLSYANFKGVQKTSALGSDAVASILASHSDIDPEWLLNGAGGMFRGNINGADHQSLTLPSKIDDLDQTNAVIEALEKVISAQQTTIQSQEITINALTSRIESLEKKKSKKKK